MPDPIITQNDVSSFIIGDATYADETYSAGAADTLAKGTILGRLTSGGNVRFYASGAADGTEIPVGVLVKEEVFTGSGTRPIRMLVRGTVRSDQLVIDGGGSITKALSDQLRDMGIVVLTVTELMKEDNE